MKNCWFCFFCCFCSLSVSGEDQLHFTRVQHDPFQKPVIQEKKDTGQQATDKPEEQKPAAPKLIATLRAGRDSMANVNGKIIKLGQTINGYTLVRVEARKAVFIKNRKFTYLTIDNQTNE